MTDFDATQFKQQAFGALKPDAVKDDSASKPIEDLSDTANQLELSPVVAAPSRRRGKLTEPTLTLAQAIDDGVTAKELKALQDQWNAFNRQEALKKASAAKAALNDQVEAGRRKIADELLKLADGYGVSMKEAKAILKEALEADKKAKGKKK